MPTTPTYGIPYPALTDPPNGPSQMSALALEVEAEIARVDAAKTAADAAWVTYVPTITQGIGLTKNVEYARWKKNGKTVHVQLSLGVTSTGNVGSAVTVTLPYAPLPYRLLGVATIFDASSGLHYVGAAWWQSATVAEIRLSGVAGAAGTATGGFTAALASGDVVAMNLTFDTA